MRTPLTRSSRPRRPSRRAPAILPLAVVIAGVLVGVTGCGDPPPYRFVADADRSMVVKLPRAWTALDPDKVQDPVDSSSIWTAFYDASGKPSADHAQLNAPATTLTAPVVRMLSIRLKEGVEKQLTDDVLRDQLVPASQTGARRLGIQAQINANPEVKFSVLEEQPVRTKNARGLRIRYAYDFGAGITVREKLVLVDPAATHLHAIEISCSPECFETQETRIDEVLASFTVKPAR